MAIRRPSGRNGEINIAMAWLVVVIGAAVSSAPAVEMAFPGPDSGPATARVDERGAVLQNHVFSIRWSLESGRMRLAEAVDLTTGSVVRARAGELFVFNLGEGRIVKASDLGLRGAPRVEDLKGASDAPRIADRANGRRVTAEFNSPDGGWTIQWSATLRDGSNYVTVEITNLESTARAKDGSVALIDLAAPNARAVGEVPGSPVAAGTMFFACEHPASENKVAGDRVTCALSGKHFPPSRLSAVIGVAPPGQLRRAFLYYVNRERAFPHRTFLHYNAWLDLNTPWKDLSEDEALHVIDVWNGLLVRGRGVKMDSFVFDDGWDDPHRLWQFICTLPNGFKPLSEAARKAGAGGAGMWISPAGGYGKKGALRREAGQAMGFIPKDKPAADQPLLLSNDAYYALFRGVCESAIREQGVNYLKFDNTATNNPRETEALLRLMLGLREVKPDLYLNVTVGTWPSPFWLWYGDTTWRGGGDSGTTGAGSTIQQWITYRDAETYKNVVRRAPLYPISALMTHGIIHTWMEYGRFQAPKDFGDEVHAYFGMGTGMQELYITPTLLGEEQAAALAAGAKWARENEDVLMDSHWIGGDPGKGEIYGYASWSPRKGILTLRNPSASPAKITISLADAFDLPSGAPQKYALRPLWKSSIPPEPIELDANPPREFPLAPFETLTLEAAPTY